MLIIFRTRSDGFYCLVQWCRFLFPSNIRLGVSLVASKGPSLQRSAHATQPNPKPKALQPLSSPS